MSEKITTFAETNFRNKRTRFGIKKDDRRRHVYIIGKTGMGKTVVSENMAIQDIQNGNGVAIVDPHGDFAEKMLDFVPSDRINDVIYFNPADAENPIAFNIMEKVDADHRHLVASGLMGAFKKIWAGMWSARMEYILHNTILALLEYPGTTLLGINRMLADKDYRTKVVEKITDPSIKSFWTKEFDKYPDRFREEAVAPIQNKVGQFISSPLIRNIVGQVRSTIDMREVMDQGKILIVNLSKGKVGEDASNLLGALIITKIQLAAMERANIAEEERKDFYLYVDEFQNFATDAFAMILSEARKYHLCLILVHQYIAQLDEMTEKGKSTKVRDAVFGNVGTIISFRIGAIDAEFLEKEFLPEFTADDLVNLNKYNIYLKLMIDGAASRAFSALTLAPFDKSEKSHKEKIIKASRERYTSLKEDVEKKLAKWSETVQIEREEKRKKFEAVCSECNKKTSVSFEPDGVRPVYCSICLQKKREDKPKQEEPKEISLQEATKQEPQSFKRKKKEVDIDDLRSSIQDAIKEE
ncbi:type IV secretion system DNA-binding domain-containing protein [Patescibacteria group bacterium]|nr:type IV secretion system DNA-binding domain-containing protein [Patescibacteria group bacterium]MBU3922626.1 type IV secretion system DNA-binding domain-containing protein [Patescibacteria group bacterium]